MTDRTGTGLAEGWRVLVTGGRGALGRALVRRLVREGAARVTAFDAQPADGEAAAARRDVIDVTGDILESEALARVLEGYDTVYHLAARTHVGRSAADVEAYLRVNVLGTAAVLEACRRRGVARVVLASSAHVYGDPARLPVRETDPVAPRSPYAASKLGAEALLHSHAAATSCACTVARIANLYGPDSGPETVIGRALRQAAGGGPIALRELASRRDFIAVDDVAEALMRLAAAPAERGRCRTVNVSTGRATSISDVAEAIARAAEALGLGRPAVTAPKPVAAEVAELVLDNGRLRELTGWVPQISLATGVRLALEGLLEPARSGRDA